MPRFVIVIAGALTLTGGVLLFLPRESPEKKENQSTVAEAMIPRSTKSSLVPVGRGEKTDPFAGLETAAERLAHVFSTGDYALLARMLREDEKGTLQAIKSHGFSEQAIAEDVNWVHLSEMEPHLLAHFKELPLEYALQRLQLLGADSVPFGHFAGALLYQLDAEEDYESALKWVAAHPESLFARGAGAALASWLLKAGPEEAWKQLGKLPAADLRAEAAMVVVDQVANKDIWKAVDLLNSGAHEEEDLNRAVANLVDAARRQDLPYDQRVYLASSPTQKEYFESALHSVFFEWSQHDKEALRTWLGDPKQTSEHHQRVIEIAQQYAQ